MAELDEWTGIHKIRSDLQERFTISVTSAEGDHRVARSRDGPEIAGEESDERERGGDESKGRKVERARAVKRGAEDGGGEKRDQEAE